MAEQNQRQSVRKGNGWGLLGGMESLHFDNTIFILLKSIITIKISAK